MSNVNPKISRLAKLGVLAALSVVLVFFIHFPISPPPVTWNMTPPIFPS